jgi:hypothetical protein
MKKQKYISKKDYEWRREAIRLVSVLIGTIVSFGLYVWPLRYVPYPFLQLTINMSVVILTVTLFVMYLVGRFGSGYKTKILLPVGVNWTEDLLDAYEAAFIEVLQNMEKLGYRINFTSLPGKEIVVYHHPHGIEIGIKLLRLDTSRPSPVVYVPKEVNEAQNFLIGLIVDDPIFSERLDPLLKENEKVIVPRVAVEFD